MTIMEAAKTGKPFRRRKWPASWGWVRRWDHCYVWMNFPKSKESGHYKTWMILPSDVLASDFEVQQ